MKNVVTSAALSLALIASSNVAFADGHADISDLTCAEFTAMDLAGQEVAIAALTAAVEDAEAGEYKIGDIEVLCNGMSEETLGDLLDNDA